MCVGIPDGDHQAIAQAFPGEMVAKETSIHGVAVGNRKDAQECLEMAARGVVKMHYTVEKMSELKTTFDAMEAGKLQGRVVLDLKA